MEIKREAMAGTLESSDAMVTVLPDVNELQIFLQSNVEDYYGDSIRATVLAVLEEMGIKTGRIEVTDRGALDCTIRARVTTAVRRSCTEEVRA